MRVIEQTTGIDGHVYKLIDWQSDNETPRTAGGDVTVTLKDVTEDKIIIAKGFALFTSPRMSLFIDELEDTRGILVCTRKRQKGRIVSDAGVHHRLYPVKN